jgi:hypothetical protein
MYRIPAYIMLICAFFGVAVWSASTMGFAPRMNRKGITGAAVTAKLDALRIEYEAGSAVARSTDFASQ